MPQQSFSELTAEEVLLLAIDVERSNGIRLRTFSELFVDYAPDAAKLFAEMADEEDEHGRLLEATYKRRFGEAQRTVTEDDVQEVIEAHDLDDGEHLVFDDMNLRRALQIILKAEHQAEAFYRQATRAASDPELEELFRQLAEFEDGHVQWIETRLETLRESA
ncbi:MAG: ferritin family protein [Planctomycetes bacterium]|nr:ferritin family protein [Planctomycetota bacterium]